MAQMRLPHFINADMLDWTNAEHFQSQFLWQCDAWKLQRLLLKHYRAWKARSAQHLVPSPGSSEMSVEYLGEQLGFSLFPPVPSPHSVIEMLSPTEIADDDFGLDFFAAALDQPELLAADIAPRTPFQLGHDPHVDYGHTRRERREWVEVEHNGLVLRVRRVTRRIDYGFVVEASDAIADLRYDFLEEDPM